MKFTLYDNTYAPGIKSRKPEAACRMTAILL
jgi:hypothetical protein